MWNLDEVRRNHDRFLAGNERLIGSAGEAAGRHALTYVQRHSDFKRRSGDLQDNTGYRVVRTRSGSILRIANPTLYAEYVEYGTKAHRITARNGKALRFQSRAGTLIFRRSVWHPGTRPYKFLWNATDSAYRVLGQELRRGMTALAERF
jgi:hypothetical protein